MNDLVRCLVDAIGEVDGRQELRGRYSGLGWFGSSIIEPGRVISNSGNLVPEIL